MTRQFKKELIEEIFLWIQEAMQAGADKRPYDPNVVKIQVLEALADHGALSEAAYEEKPFTILFCRTCRAEIIPNPGSLSNTNQCCGLNLIKMVEVKE